MLSSTDVSLPTVQMTEKLEPFNPGIPNQPLDPDANMAAKPSPPTLDQDDSTLSMRAVECDEPGDESMLDPGSTIRHGIDDFGDTTIDLQTSLAYIPQADGASSASLHPNGKQSPTLQNRTEDNHHLSGPGSQLALADADALLLSERTAGGSILSLSDNDGTGEGGKTQPERSSDTSSRDEGGSYRESQQRSWTNSVLNKINNQSEGSSKLKHLAQDDLHQSEEGDVQLSSNHTTGSVFANSSAHLQAARERLYAQKRAFRKPQDSQPGSRPSRLTEALSLEVQQAPRQQQPSQVRGKSLLTSFRAWVSSLTPLEKSQIRPLQKAFKPHIFQSYLQWQRTMPRDEAMQMLVSVLQSVTVQPPPLPSTQVPPPRVTRADQAQISQTPLVTLKIPRGRRRSSSQSIPYSFPRLSVSKHGNLGEIRSARDVEPHYMERIFQVDEGPGSDDILDVVEIHVPDDLAGALRYDAPDEVWERFKVLKCNHVESARNSDENSSLVAGNNVNEGAT